MCCLVFLLAACGGGGDRGGSIDSIVEDMPLVTQPPVVRLEPPLFKKGTLQTSYELQHSVLHVDARSLPFPSDRWLGVFAYGDFDGDGDEDVLHAPLDGTVNPSPLELYLNDGDGEYRLDNRLFESDTPGLVHPRKILTGDFNGDGRLDVFVAGHGYDKPPFPGEAPLLLLSSEEGLRKQEGFDHIVGFHHSAASADIDHDGDLDIFVTSQWDDPFFLKNDGQGNFVYDTSPVPPGLKSQPGLQFYTTEIVDVDDDGYPDLITAGHEGPRELGRLATAIYWGDRSGTYDDSRKTLLPWVQGQEVVLDIDVGDLNGDGKRDIVLNRTSLDPFYQGYFIQILSGRDGRQFADETIWRIGGGSDPNSNWILWLRLEDIDNDGDLDILSDSPHNAALAWLNDGSGKLSGSSEPDRAALAAPQPPLTDAEIREQMSALIQASNTITHMTASNSVATSTGYDTVSGPVAEPLRDIGETTYKQKASRNGVVLAAGRHPDDGATDFTGFAGWMEHSFFLLAIEDRQNHVRSDIYSGGSAIGTNPTSGGASWKGVMFGVDGSTAKRGHVLRGDAEITITGFEDLRTIVAFTNLYDLNTAIRRPDIRWSDLRTNDGVFRSDCSVSPSNCIEGRFYGPEHEEVGGVFLHNHILGAFGAKR